MHGAVGVTSSLCGIAGYNRLRNAKPESLGNPYGRNQKSKLRKVFRKPLSKTVSVRVSCTEARRPDTEGISGASTTEPPDSVVWKQERN